MRKRIPPSRGIREELERWPEGAEPGDEQPLPTLVRLAAQLVWQELLEAEVRDYLRPVSCRPSLGGTKATREVTAWI